ncbi:MAG: OsmC family protein [Bacteroidota bacterium]
MESIEQPKVRHRSFSYTTNLSWAEGRIGTMTSEGKPALKISSPPEFKGNAGYWTPEDVFVGSVEMCQMLTFIGIAQKQNVPFISYKSSAKGTLEFIDGQYRFTHIVVSPVVVVDEPGTESQINAVIREAHKRCLIANSITAIVEVNPTIQLKEKIGGEVT